MAGQVQGKAVVPKFGSWDAENIGYTVFFEKVRENKTAPVPATAPPKAGRDDGDYEFDPYEHYENLSRNAPSRPPSSQGHGHGHAPPPPQYYDNPGRNAPPSRPPSSHGQGHPAPQYYDNLARNAPPSSDGHGQHGYGGYHRRNGSNGSSAASEVSSRASKFSPPRPYHPRYSNNSGGSYHQPQPQQQQGNGAYSAPAPRHHHQHAAPAPAPRVAASPPRHAPPPVHERRPSQQGVRAAKAPSAVPKFGVWDEQNAAQGFTVQFEKVQRQREVAKVAAPVMPPPRQQLAPDGAAPEWGRPRRKPRKSFLSKVYGCLFPVVRQ